mgnify:CR=1 FL=1
MPGQQNTILFEMKGAAAGALGADSPSGVDTDAAKDGTNKEQSSFFKKMKNVPKQIASFSKSSLGVQFSLAAMLRQSQIATGFLSAMFQVLGAIVDSFLVAFAPTLFSAIAGMAKLIPVARAVGFGIVDSVNAVREGIWNFMNWTLPLLKWIGKGILGVVKFVMGLPKIILGLGVAGLLLGKLVAHFKVKHYTVMYQINFKSTLKALTIHSARSGGKAAAGGGGLLAMAGGINPIVGIVMTVAAVAAPLIMGFLGRDKSSQGVDVAGQLGKKYLPSQGSRLGTDLNTLMSSGFEETFVKIQSDIQENTQEWFPKMATPIEDAVGRTATGLDSVVALYEGSASEMSKSAAEWLEASRKMSPKAWAERRAAEAAALAAAAIKAADPGGHRNLTSIGGGAYTGIGSGATSNEVTTTMKNAAREWANEQRKMTDYQKQVADAAAQRHAAEAARAEQRHAVWMSRQGINEGIF